MCVLHGNPTIDLAGLFKQTRGFGNAESSLRRSKTPTLSARSVSENLEPLDRGRPCRRYSGVNSYTAISRRFIFGVVIVPATDTVRARALFPSSPVRVIRMPDGTGIHGARS